jgi:glycosyltransferase involved in cell wall biosynthesis
MNQRIQGSNMISVIVPVYNGADRIIRCLESIKHQTYTDFECIVIDDGSTDGSYDLVEKWINDDRFHLYRQENAGVAITRNRGIEYAKGEFIAFADQDDYVMEEYLTHMVNAADDKTDVVVGGYERVTDVGNDIFNIKLTKGEFSKFVVPTPWAHLYRKSFIQDKGIRFLDSKIGEDIYFNIMAYCRTPNVKVLENCTDYKWVDNKRSVSNSLQKSVGNEIDPIYLLNNIKRGIPEKCYVSADLLEYFFIRYCVWYALFVMRGTSKDKNIEVQSKLFSWLSEEYPYYNRNRYIRIRPDGEIKKYHMAVRVWIFFRRVNADRIITGIMSGK